MEEKIKKAASLYLNDIEIPDELEKLVSDSVKEGKRGAKLTMLFRPLTAAAVIVLVFVGALNLSEPFARAAASMPIIGNIAKVLTFRQYESKTPSYIITVKTPEISGLTDPAYQKKINEQLDTRLKKLEEEIKIQAENDRRAFIATGGKPEDFRPVQIKIDFEVKHNSNGVLSLIVSKTASTFAAYNQTLYYNIDVNGNKEISLESLFGKKYTAIINAEIKKQIEEKTAKGGVAFFKGDMGFKTINQNQSFYINEYGNPVIVFEKYTIAPGAYGSQYFEVERNITKR